MVAVEQALEEGESVYWGLTEKEPERVFWAALREAIMEGVLQVEGDREGLTVGVEEEEEVGVPRSLVRVVVEDSVVLGERELVAEPVVKTLEVA